MFDDNNDDFQLPDNFDMVNVVADGVLSLAHVYYPNNGKRRKISEKEAWPISVNSTIDTVSPSSK